MRETSAQLITSIPSQNQEERPWGSYIVLEEAAGYKIKRVTVQPGHQLSLQLHYYRSEHWVVVSGFAEVDLNNAIQMVRKGESMFVPSGTKHRLKNPGIIPLEVLEVQIGEYLGEDDIVRFEDDYDRLEMCSPQEGTPEVTT
jgi:mannose-1-phosphate guanylyltransferase / mannose-6-phosphate isomerase